MTAPLPQQDTPRISFRYLAIIAFSLVVTAIFILSNSSQLVLAQTVATPTPAGSSTALAAGSQALVNDLGGKSLLVLSSIDKQAVKLTGFESGTLVTITTSAQKSQGLTWWRVRGDGIEGWVLDTITIANKPVSSLVPFTHDSLAQYIQELSAQPITPALLNKRGLLSYAQQDNASALNDFSDSIKLDSRNPITYFYRALAEDAQKDDKSAVADLTMALKLHPQDPILLNARGIDSHEIGDNTNGVIDLAAAIKLSPKFATAYNNLGVTDWDLNKFSVARNDYMQAINIDPFYSRAYNNVGTYYLYIEDFPNALIYLNKAIEAEPAGFYVFYSNRGEAYEQLGNSAAAIADCNRAIALNPNYAEPYIFLGMATFDQGDQATGIQTVKHAIQLDPTRVEAFFYLGLLYGKQESYQDAVDAYSQALKIDPKNIASLVNRGNAYDSLKQYQLGIADFTTLITLNPGAAGYYYSDRGNIYKDSGDTNKALADYAKGIELAPTYAAGYYNRGLLYNLMSRQADAIPDLKEAIALDPQFVDAYKELGYACYITGQYAEALAALETYETLTNDPDPWVVDTVAKLKANQ